MLEVDRATTAADDRYILLLARRNRTDNATQLQRQLFLAQDEGCPAKQCLIGFIREVSMHIGQLSAFPWPYATVQSKEDGLLNIEIGSRMIGAECFLQTSPDSV